MGRMFRSQTNPCVSCSTSCVDQRWRGPVFGAVSTQARDVSEPGELRPGAGGVNPQHTASRAPLLAEAKLRAF